jgi:hypothetical protein
MLATKGGKTVWVKVLVHELWFIQNVVFLTGFHMRYERKDLIGDFFLNNKKKKKKKNEKRRFIEKMPCT